MRPCWQRWVIDSVNIMRTICLKFKNLELWCQVQMWSFSPGHRYTQASRVGSMLFEAHSPSVRELGVLAFNRKRFKGFWALCVNKSACVNEITTIRRSEGSLVWRLINWKVHKSKSSRLSLITKVTKNWIDGGWGCGMVHIPLPENTCRTCCPVAIGRHQ